MHRYFFFFFYICFSCITAFAQEGHIKKFKDELADAKSDVKKIQLMNNLAREYADNSDTALAMQYLNQALDLSKKINDYYSLGCTYSTMGVYYVRISDYERSDACFKTAYDYYSKGEGDTCKWGCAITLGEMAGAESRKGDYEKAIAYKLKAIDIINATSFEDKPFAISNIYGGIGTLYADHNQFDKAIYYDKKALESWLIKGVPTLDLGSHYIYLADDFIGNNQIDSAKKYMELAKKIADTLNIPQLHAMYYNFSAKIFFSERNFPLALEYGLKARGYALQAKSIMSQLIAHLSIARSYKEMGKPAKALPYLEEELELAEKIRSEREQQIALVELSEVEAQLKRYDKAYSYLQRYTILNDTLHKRAEKMKMNEIEAKYQNEKKELQIAQLEKEKQIQQLTLKQKNTWLLILIGSLVSISVIGFLFYKNKKRKQLLTEQANVLKGQEAERSRIAKDLHDGLGGMLSGIKMNLSSMKGNEVMKGEDAVLFSKSISQLDNAINEMRRLAHNMVPEALVKFGLPEAIQDFCDNINESNGIKMRFTQLGWQQPVDPTTGIILYRIVQELSNNAIKHASAKNIFIQLSRHEQGITLTVEDDGKGFDMKQLPDIKGAGLQNVQSRVEYLKGILEIQSSPDQGTSVNIEIALT